MQTRPEPSENPESGADGERLSAWLDGEGADADSTEVVAGLLRDGAARRRFDAYCFVGDALRSQEVAAEHAPRLCARVARALQDEPSLLAPGALEVRRVRPALMRNVASAAAVAAAGAVLVLVAVPQLRNNLLPAQQLVQGAPPAPAEGLASVQGDRSQRLDPYLQAHREFSTTGVMPAAAVDLRFGTEPEQ